MITHPSLCPNHQSRSPPVKSLASMEHLLRAGASPILSLIPKQLGRADNPDSETNLNLSFSLWPGPKWGPHLLVFEQWHPGYPGETSAPQGPCPPAPSQRRSRPEAAGHRVGQIPGLPSGFRGSFGSDAPQCCHCPRGAQRPGRLGFWHPPEQLPRQKGFVFPG